MRIAIVVQDIIKGDGQGRANYEIAYYALSQRHKVFLIANKVDKELIKKGAIWIPTKIPASPMLLKVLLFVHKTNKILKKLKTDVIYSTGFSLTKKHEINTAQFVHNTWIKSPVHTSKMRKDFYGLYQWIFTKLNSYFEKISFNRAKAIVAVSKKIRQDLIEIGIPKKKVYTIYNGVDIKEFHHGKVDRKKLNLPEKVPLALFAGDINTSRKNLDTVLKALVNIPELHLSIIGKDKNSPYPKLTKKLKIMERVHFLGYRKDVADIMRAVDLFVFPSRYDPFGNVILEAMASGLPVITSKTVGASELITTGKDGIVLENPNDVLRLTKAMKLIVKNPKKRKEMGESARYIAEKYTWKIIAEKYIKLFEKVRR